ncbi:MAG: hypothetical protein HC869_20065, partial [Rhodospirillales bacterium]|nr:hypothetical protein [Rhodospirillales bacterium]
MEIHGGVLQGADAAANGIEEQDVDPLVLDLDGDGLELTARSSISPRFDVDGDLYAEVTGWVGVDDGFLATDLNANGKIDGLNELFGTPTANGFTVLKDYDSNGDKIVDATDAKFGDLRIWQDLDGDAVTDSGELKTLTEAGIASISVNFTEVSKTNATNRVAGEGTFTKTDGTTSSISDVRFNADQYNTTYTGDKTIDPTIAATQPKLKGHGTLADLQVVLTLEQAANQSQPGALAQAIAATLPTLNVVDLAELRDRSLPILQAWAAASPTTPGPWPWNNPDVAILVDRSENTVAVVDFAIQVTEEIPVQGGGTTTVTYWKRASGDDTHDANGNVIDYPTREQVMADQPLGADQSWDLMAGDTLDFIERFFGVNVPLEDMDILQHATIAPMSALLSKAEGIIELLAVRLAMQGPLASYFEGITYDVTRDAFLPTTDRQLTPMFEAIFEDAPGTAQGAENWLKSWEPIIDTVITDYKRGHTGLINSYAFIFTGIVAAYENVGLAIDVKQAAVALGLPENQINIGTGERTGTSSNDIFYLGAGNDTVKGGAGPDTYVVGK